MSVPALSLRECSPAELREANRSFYEGMWRDAKLVAPQRFSTWPLVAELAAQARNRLEVAPGLRPRLPIAGTHFVDISAPALDKLTRAGGLALRGQIGAMPFPDAHFDLVCALDIIEHVDDDRRAVAELARVAAPGAVLLLSVPLYERCWTAFDDFVGHRRRYEPEAVQALLVAAGFTAERSAVFGMQPRSSRLLDLGMWCLVHRRRRAMWCYNHLFLPMGLRFQRPLQLVEGFALAPGIDEIFLVCRRR